MAKRRLKIQAVCGVGMGSCQLVKMLIEKVAQDMGISVDVEACDPSVCGGANIDMIVTTPFLATGMGHLRDKVKIVEITNFVDADHVRERVTPAFKELVGE